MVTKRSYDDAAVAARLLLLSLVAFTSLLTANATEHEEPPPESFTGHCMRTPNGIAIPKIGGDNGLSIRISGNPAKYAPGEKYTVTLQGYKNEKYVQKFIGFMLVVEPLETRNDISARPDVGDFQLFGDALSMFSPDCPNSVVQTSSIPKSEIQVMWRAPAVGSGCVVFKATVVENRDRWYMDEGNLKKVLCEQEQENEDEQPEVNEECCACDEAKYELTFEGIWSRHTHPKDFPTNEWLTHFSDIIGASHTGDFRIWEYGGYASEGVRQVAEWGATKKLESELKDESKKIQTIIKARGLWYPNVNGKTFAVFRVDKQHHLMSFLTMLGPSPDWIVGVSALELCLKNCSWITEKVMNLYPWDAGTDSGLSYISTNSPTVPQERIHRITASNPNTEASPFYDPTGSLMKPVARLTVTRQRVYEKSCEEIDLSTAFPTGEGVGGAENGDDRPVIGNFSAECAVTEWSEFTPCSVTCGQGITMRTRHYYNPQKAEMMGCLTLRTEKQLCDAECIGNVSCKTTPWGAWSECSVTCDKGLRTRSRKYIDPKARKVCTLDLMEKEMCMGMKRVCDTPDPIDPKCAVTHWSEWSPCTVTCGKGLKVRTRLYLNPASMNICSNELMQRAPCTADRPDCLVDLSEATEICMQPKEVGPCRGYFPRWHYDASRAMCVQFVYGGCRGNRNNFERYTDCSKMCEDMLKDYVRAPLPPSTIAYAYTMKDASVHLDRGLVCAPISTLASLSTPADFTRDQPTIDCVVTPWSDWTPCSSTCGNGRKERRRMIKLNPENGGKPCPRKLVQRRKCKDNPPCSEGRVDKVAIDCMLNLWSEWSVCSKTCGQGGIQQRVRTVKRPPKYGGAPCGPKVERKYCSLPPCPFY